MKDNTYYKSCTKCGRPQTFCKGECCGTPQGCQCKEYGPKACGCIRQKAPECPYEAVIPSVTVESVSNLKDLADCFVHVSDINTTFYIDDKHRIMTTWAGLVSVNDYDFEANPLNLRGQIAYDSKNNKAAIYDKQGANYIFQISDIDNNYLLLENKPSINGVELSGDKSSEELGIPEIDEVAMVFDTVADMKVSTSLTAGGYARTLGFHAINDGGGAIYKITDTGTANEMDVIAVGSLFANLVEPPIIVPEMFGAYGDGTHDDTTALQRCIDIADRSFELISGKVYSFATTLNITRRYFHLDGKSATLKYTGSNNAVHVNMEPLASHRRDVSELRNIVFIAPNSQNVLALTYVNKCRFENLRVYDFPHNGINLLTGCYECYFNNITMGCRKMAGTVGITGHFGDSEFGNLFGVNVETFIYGKPWGSNNISKIHAWCFNGSMFADEPAMSEEQYNAWFANTVLIKVDSNTGANAWPTVIEYCNCDTYHTAIDFKSYWRNLQINKLIMYSSPQLFASDTTYQNYLHYILIEHLRCPDAIADVIPTIRADRVPNIHYVNDFEYEYVQTQTYTSADDQTVTLNVSPNELRWIEIPKPAANLTLNAINVYAFIPFKEESESAGVNVRRAWVNPNNNSFIYPSYYDNGATTAFALARSFGIIGADNSRLVPKPTYTT